MYTSPSHGEGESEPWWWPSEPLVGHGYFQWDMGQVLLGQQRNDD